MLGLKVPKDLQITAEVPDVSRADNKVLADSAKTIVEAFATMKGQGWIDDETAIRLSFKFAGEILPEAKIKELLENAESEAESEVENEATEPTE